MKTPSASASPRARARLDERRWRLLAKRDPRADGRFVFSVRSTGVYCRPSCPARAPKRENVAFHETAQDAERAGFRACKRCRPDGTSTGERRAALIATACRVLETSAKAPSLARLAKDAGLSPFHFHRQFVAETGVTPRAFARAARARRLREGLRQARNVESAIQGAGYGSSGRVYARSAALLGMRPAEFRAGAPSVTIRHATRACSLGFVLVAATDRGLCAILLGDDKAELLEDLRRRFSQAELRAAGAEFRTTLRQVLSLIDDPRRASRLPLDLRGSAFQARVWRALQSVPCGETRSYGEIARAIQAPRAVRAVAAACAANPLAVAVPCHRALRADGNLAGYRWGLWRKRELLERENAQGLK